MLLVIDKYIPFICDTIRQASAEDWQQVQVLPLDAEEITPSVVRDADALFVRTRTQINAALLAQSSVRLVATATIGYDHIDQDFCRRAGIRWVSCPGCNAQAVCDYIEEALLTLQTPLKAKKIGIVGVGHVGSLVAEMAERHGMQVLLNDPPHHIGVSLDEIAQTCDIITFHTPLTRSGDYPTYHLCDEAFLRRCRPDTLIINAARGGVVDEAALLAAGQPCVIDTWENEPRLNRELLQFASLASFHIAGYSVQGKYNASQTCLNAFGQQFGLSPLQIDKKVVPLQQKYGDSASGWLSRVSDALKANPDQFEQLRKQYRLR
ncbi:MAG: 4-phosphoerythronate dehydrogenase [Paludibacteraceae bacterium]|nr:4-phosphoerythronate dehydrogenase [Paludibacteraceae bacterium]